MTPSLNVEEAEAFLGALAQAFLATGPDFLSTPGLLPNSSENTSEGPSFEARYNALIEHIPGVIFVAPLQFGRGKAWVSPQIQTILGFSQAEWLEDPLRWYQQVHPDDKERWSVEAASLFLSGEPLSSTYRVIARDGRVLWFQCDARMVHSTDGSPSFIHGVGFDVTETKVAEVALRLAHDELESRVAERTQALALANVQLQQEISGHKRTVALLTQAKEAAETSARLKKEFVANMSHELRTPLNGVLGLIQLVLNTDLTPQQRRQLHTAHNSAQSLLNIVNDVLDFAKLQSGTAALNQATFGLRECLDKLIADARPQIAAKALDLNLEVSAHIPDLLVGDPERLRQVLVNLIDNAIKFTARGFINVQVALDGSTQDSLTLKFSVTDTGIGIPASAIETIFDPFVQVNGSSTREHGGTGIGLAISRELVSLLGGRLDVVSVLGAGSTFSFTAVFRAAGSRATPSVAPGLPFRVLVVEDNAIDQMVITGLLGSKGYKVTLATNGFDAVRMFRESSFDLVLMDVLTPVMSGFEATRAIRAIESERGQTPVPIVGVSSHTKDFNRADSLLAGMNVYVCKPFKGAELIAIVGQLIERSSATTA